MDRDCRERGPRTAIAGREDRTDNQVFDQQFLFRATSSFPARLHRLNKRFGIDVHIVEKIICNSILFLEVELIQFTRHLLTMPAVLITAFLSTEAGSAQGCFALIAINARSCSLPRPSSPRLLPSLSPFLFTLGSKVWQLETAARSVSQRETAAVGGGGETQESSSQQVGQEK